MDPVLIMQDGDNKVIETMIYIILDELAFITCPLWCHNILNGIFFPIEEDR